jgi:hypothetical protein
MRKSENFPTWHPKLNADGLQNLSKLLNGKFLPTILRSLSASSLGYREKKARALFAKIQNGELSIESETAVRRDYEEEFKKLGLKA